MLAVATILLTWYNIVAIVMGLLFIIISLVGYVIIEHIKLLDCIPDYTLNDWKKLTRNMYLRLLLIALIFYAIWGGIFWW